MGYAREICSRTFPFSSPVGSTGVFYVAGFYDASGTDANLTQASPSVTYGSANGSYAAHPFIVAGGAGSVDTGQVGLRVSGTVIDDAGNRTPTTTRVLTTDITTLSLDEYVEVDKFLGQVTFEFYTVSGSPTTYSLDINYGYAAYLDFGNRNFTTIGFDVQGRAGANDSGFDIEFIHHKAAGWTYAATGFEPGSSTGIITQLTAVHGAESNLINGDAFRFKRIPLSQEVAGAGEEGVLVRFTTGSNNAVETSSTSICIEKLYT